MWQPEESGWAAFIWRTAFYLAALGKKPKSLFRLYLCYLFIKMRHSFESYSAPPRNTHFVAANLSKALEVNCQLNVSIVWGQCYSLKVGGLLTRYILDKCVNKTLSGCCTTMTSAALFARRWEWKLSTILHLLYLITKGIKPAELRS